MEAVWEKLDNWWRSLGILGPSAVLVLGGLLCVLGGVFRWRWLYPDHPDVRYRSAGFRRMTLLLIGVVLILCGVVFYITRDHMSGP